MTVTPLRDRVDAAVVEVLEQHAVAAPDLHRDLVASVMAELTGERLVR